MAFTAPSPTLPIARPLRATPRLVDPQQRRALLRSASHELRTPLNSIIGFAEVLDRQIYGPLGAPEYREYAAIIRESGLKLLRLVNEVLEIARLEHDVEDLEPVPACLASAVEEVCAGLAHGCEGVDIDPALTGVTVRADQRALRGVLACLLQTGASANGGAAGLRLRVRRADTERCPLVLLQVLDRGPTLPREAADRLLQPFSVAALETSGRQAGAGVSLPIAGLLAEAMGGDLRLRPRPGGGMAATLALPAA